MLACDYDATATLEFGPEPGRADDRESAPLPVRRKGVIMGYSLACRDVMPGCAATFNAETEDELLTQVGPHTAQTLTASRRSRLRCSTP